MNKCKWINNHIIVCDKLMIWLNQEVKRPEYAEKNFDRCPFCGADIRKPEPEKPLIVENKEMSCTGANLGQCKYVYIRGNGFGCNYNYLCAFQRPQKSTAHELQESK